MFLVDIENHPELNSKMYYVTIAFAIHNRLYIVSEPIQNMYHELHLLKKNFNYRYFLHPVYTHF